MAYNKDIVEKLSQFNNLSFTKKQWDIILKGCGCPKSAYFWMALKENNLQRCFRIYTLLDIDSASFDTIWNKYCELNRASVKKAYIKEKAKKKAREKVAAFTGITLYMVNGCLTTEKPERD